MLCDWRLKTLRVRDWIYFGVNQASVMMMNHAPVEKQHERIGGLVEGAQPSGIVSLEVREFYRHLVEFI